MMSLLARLLSDVWERRLAAGAEIDGGGGGGTLEGRDGPTQTETFKGVDGYGIS